MLRDDSTAPVHRFHYVWHNNSREQDSDKLIRLKIIIVIIIIPVAATLECLLELSQIA